MRRRALVLGVLLGVGSLQMVGDLTGIPAVRGVGLATSMSPAPRVFSVADGLETYSTRFVLEWTDRAGELHELSLTPEVYRRLRGPYNRRNVYGAALAYGPVLARRSPAMLESVLRYALCDESPLLREVGLDPREIAGPVVVRYEPIEGTDLGGLPDRLTPSCR